MGQLAHPILDLAIAYHFDNGQCDESEVVALDYQERPHSFYHIVRYQNDMQWPNPVWGVPAVPYTKEVLAQMQQTLMMALRGHHQMPFDWQM